ncbi:MAG: VOC family protein [Gammaproteobacteria bacterium]|jgi:catechol 2,3-dioxygenase-like lactoylglutathione lyase family enzyme|tara:strand:+ start:152 stop:1159 length:1008 start_codon:yes stop_codon:yes gene_type:complete
MPVIKATAVQYCTLQCPDLDIQEQFLIHFGMHTVEKTDDTLIMRGDGPQPFIEVCKKGEKKFLGATYVAQSMEDLEKISKTEAFSDIEKLETPGGGYISRGKDLDGIGVEVCFGIKDRDEYKPLVPLASNEGGQVNRINQRKRYVKGDLPTIVRFAHYGINSNDIPAALEWYNEHLGIIATDKLFQGDPKDPETPMMGIFARLDKGSEPADHHTIFWLPAMLSEGRPGLNHVSFEMLQIDDVLRGHEILQRNKEEFDYELEWGVGRHYQGAQVFDYWRSPFKQTHEHQTDGDYFDNTFPPNEVNVTEDGLESDGDGPSQWGPDINFETFGDIRNG